MMSLSSPQYLNGRLLCSEISHFTSPTEQQIALSPQNRSWQEGQPKCLSLHGLHFHCYSDDSHSQHEMMLWDDAMTSFQTAHNVTYSFILYSPLNPPKSTPLEFSLKYGYKYLPPFFPYSCLIWSWKGFLYPTSLVEWLLCYIHFLKSNLSPHESQGS